MGILLAGFVLVALLPTINSTAVGTLATDLSRDFSSENIPEDFYVQPNDLDGNRVHDVLDDLTKDNVEQSQLMLILDEPLQLNELSTIQSMSSTPMHQWQTFGVLEGTFNLQDIPLLLELPSISFVEPVFPCHALLLQSTQQLRVRPYLWDLGYEGLSHLSTAILDTGIDDNHTDFNGRVIAWYDFVGADIDTNGDEYDSPTDINGHGTHIASVLAGSGQMSDQQSSNITASGRFDTDPSESKGLFYIPFVLKETLNFSIDVIFHGSGQVVAQLQKLTGPNQFSLETDYGSFSGNFTLIGDMIAPGEYVAAFYCESSLKGNSISVQLSSSTSSEDSNYPRLYKGIAPQTNIVALKVLDDLGFGESDDLLDALNWVKNHRDSYNISVVNLSLGFEHVVSVIDSAIETLTRDYGLVVVAAAGNLGSSPGGIYSPGSAPEAITVGAINAANEVAYYSSIGSSSQNWKSKKPDLMAPGGSFAISGSSAPLQVIVAADTNDADEDDDLYTEELDGFQSDYFENDYSQSQGTSLAAPHVSGIAQLLIQALDAQIGWNWSYEYVARIKMLMLIATYEVYGQGDQGGETYDGETQEPTIDRTEKDYTEGWGAILADAAISAVTTTIQVNSSMDFELGNGVTDPKVNVTRIALLEGDRVSFRLDVPLGFDLDLLVFEPNPNSYGEPVIAGSSTHFTSGADETVNISAAVDGDYFIAVRWISGNGIKTTRLHTGPDTSPLPTSSESTNTTGSGITRVWSFQILILALAVTYLLRRRFPKKGSP